MEPKNEQTQKNQASNEAAKSLQPKKTWIEPELVRMSVESGEDLYIRETFYGYPDSSIN
jgi:hypothetical protein